MTASGELDRREMLIVRIHTDDGTVGSGRAVPLSLRGGPGLRVGRRRARRICAPLSDRASQSSRIRRTSSPGLGCSSAAGPRTSARRRSRRSTSPCTISAESDAGPCRSGDCSGAERPAGCTATRRSTPTPPALAASRGGAPCGRLHDLQGQGGDGGDDERVAAVRGGGGSTARIRIDANGAWDVTGGDRPDRRSSSRSASSWSSSPAGRSRELAAVRAATSIPIVADESVSDLADEAEQALAARRLRRGDAEAGQGRRAACEALRIAG